MIQIIRTYFGFDGATSLVELSSDMAHDDLLHGCVSSHGRLEPDMWSSLNESLKEYC